MIFVIISIISLYLHCRYSVVKCATTGEHLILAANRVESTAAVLDTQFEVISTCKGSF